MFRKTVLLAIPLCLAIVHSQCDAQVVMPGTFGPVVTTGPIYTPPVQGPIYYPPVVNQFPGQIIYPPATTTIQPGVPWRPSTPAVVTGNTYTGYNPQTGGLNTANTQWNNTFFDPLRNQSQLNNRRWERRPVTNQWGQTTGYQQGWVWNNAMTGQEHGNLQTYTPNATGGVHQGEIHYSRAEPGN